MRSQKTYFYYAMIILTIILGVVLSFLMASLYENDSLPRCVVIGLIFFILTFCDMLLISLMSLTEKDRSKISFLIPLLLSVVVFAMATGLEFIYELAIPEREQIDSGYIFAVDNSESTLDTDPDNLRYEAVSTMVGSRGSDFKYSIYSFGLEVERTRTYSDASGSDNVIPEAVGGTPIKNTLEIIAEDIENLPEYQNQNLQVILISDGYATDIGLFDWWSLNGTLKGFAKKNIPVITVGFEQCDDDLMQSIADKTGGMFIRVDEASKLSGAVAEAAELEKSVDMLTSRQYYSTARNVLCTIMRPVFIIMIGAVIMAVKATSRNCRRDTGLIGITSMVFAAIAALLTEVVMQRFGLAESINRVLVYVLMTTTIATVVRGVSGSSGGGGSHSDNTWSVFDGGLDTGVGNSTGGSDHDDRFKSLDW